MSDSTILLYDLARRGDANRCWSYNAWKTRLVLNYKRVPYQTVWVNHDTLGPTLRSLGLPANTSPGAFEYTVPTIKLPDKSMVTESAVIAAKLEAIHPSPSLRLDTQLQIEADRAVHQTAMPLFAIYMPQVARNIVSENTVPTFVASREKRFGMKLEDMEKARGGEQAWIAAAPGFAAVKALLTERKKDDGPFIHGSQVCYADFVLVALFEAFKQAGDGMFEKAIAQDEAFGKVYEAAKTWLQGNQ